MSIDRLYHDPELAELYDLDNGWGEDLDYCLALGDRVSSVLDLGCGTGRLIAELARHRVAVGVDPAEAMLAVARRRPGGDRATWITGDARTVRLGQTFDLVVMTGHAFQTLLTGDDQLAALRTIAGHLAPEGRFIVDTRNPLLEEWRAWTPERSRRTLSHPRLGPLEAWNDVRRDPVTGNITYETHYRVIGSGRTISGTNSELRFTDRDGLADLISAAGLAVEAWLGDWMGGPCTPQSPEIIPYGGLAT
ncbi:MAG: class I SAM-dependent methyltransferase [Hyphomicrobiaceae bacterium]